MSQPHHRIYLSRIADVHSMRCLIFDVWWLFSISLEKVSYAYRRFLKLTNPCVKDTYTIGEQRSSVESTYPRSVARTFAVRYTIYRTRGIYGVTAHAHLNHKPHKLRVPFPVRWLKFILLISIQISTREWNWRLISRYSLQGATNLFVLSWTIILTLDLMCFEFPRFLLLSSAGGLICSPVNLLS